MKMAIYEVIEKVNEIDKAVNYLSFDIKADTDWVVELLQEYRDKILSAKVDI